MAYLAGIDLGTSGLKVVILDEQGRCIASCAQDYQFDSPVNGYAQQDVDVWWQACCHCLQGAIAQMGRPAGEIKGVSFSGQMHGVVFLDAALRSIRPAILHCDARSGEQVKWMKETLGETRIRNILMNPIYTGFMLPSLLWVRANEPQHYEAIRHVMLPKDYLKFKLTGEIASDYSDASATLAFDIQNMRWSDEVLACVDVEKAIFPVCYATDQVMGSVTKAAAEQCGLAEGTKVVSGGGDQVMQAIGNGATQPGQATVNIGTSGQVCFQSGQAIQNPALNTNTFCAYEKDRWIVMGATMSAGLSFKWLNSLFGKTDYAELNASVAKVAPGSDGLIFLPYLMGERTPHLNPNISGLFMGLQTNTQRPQLSRAVMEGVAYSLKQCLDLCNGMGLYADTYIASGGGARSEPWLQLQADIYQVPLKVAKTEEQAGVGAAIAAGAGIGIYENIEQGCREVVQYHDKIYEPNPENAGTYQAYYELYKETYKACRSVLQSVTELGRK